MKRDDPIEFVANFKLAQNQDLTDKELMKLAELEQPIRIIVALHPNATNEVIEKCIEHGDFHIDIFKIRSTGMTQEMFINNTAKLSQTLFNN